MNFPSREVEFDREGNIHQPQIVDAEMADFPAADITDLFVISHGWNNDIAEAKQLYEDFFASAARVLKKDQPPAFAPGKRRLAVLKVFWPSKRFTDEELIPGGGLASASPGEEDSAVLEQLERMKNDPERLGVLTVDPVRGKILDQAKALVPLLDGDPAARREFVFLLRSLLDPAHAHPDDGSDDFFAADPEDLFKSLSDPVGTIHTTADDTGGGLAGVDGGPAGLIGDFFDGVKGAARRLLNFGTYYEMKERAAATAWQVIRRMHQRRPDLRIHLIGHSFGGRLITAAAHALPDDTTIQSMTLLQAAYSHNGLAQKFDEKRDGFFRSLISRGRVTGPISITHTRNDKAVGVAYPLASKIARDPLASLAALGDANDPYGGMGRNGAQHTPEAAGRNVVLESVGQVIRFDARMVHNFNADACILDHNDVCKEPTAYLALAAAAST